MARGGTAVAGESAMDRRKKSPVSPPEQRPNKRLAPSTTRRLDVPGAERSKVQSTKARDARGPHDRDGNGEQR